MEQTAKRGSLRQSPNRLNAVPAQSRSEEGGSVAGGEAAPCLEDFVWQPVRQGV